MTEPPVVDPAAVERLRRLGGANLVRQMLELYLAQGPERIRSLLDGAAMEEADRVERSAHTMKSSAGTPSIEVRVSPAAIPGATDLRTTGSPSTSSMWISARAGRPSL